MRPLTKAVLVVLAVPAAVLAYFAPNLWGYYRFTQYCEHEGGLRIHHKLKKGVPWQADHFGSYSVASHGTVPFIRVRRSGALFDMRYWAGPPDDDRSYHAVPSDLSVSPGYEIRLVRERLPDELRLSRTGYEVHEIATGRLMVSWYQFSFSRFDQDRTLLAAPSSISCHSGDAFFESSNFTSYFDD